MVRSSRPIWHWFNGMKVVREFSGAQLAWGNWVLRKFSREASVQLNPSQVKLGLRALCLSPTDRSRHLQIKEKFKNLFWYLAICCPMVFCCVLWPLCCVSVSLLILIMAYNFRHESSRQLPLAEQALARASQRKANGKTVWLRAMCCSLQRTQWVLFI